MRLLRHRRLRACSTRRAASSGRCPEGDADVAGRPSAASSRTAASSTPTAKRALHLRRAAAAAGADRRAAYPLTLLTGRGQLGQWHTQTRTGKSAVLRRLAARGDYVEVSPEDARARQIGSNDLVEVVSARARVTLRAFVTRSVRPGELFIPMHGPTINKLTFAAFDPHSRQPAYKACAVELRRPAPL